MAWRFSFEWDEPGKRARVAGSLIDINRGLLETREFGLAAAW